MKIVSTSISHAQLRSFNAVASEGSISGAARKLGLSQPAVTAQIRSLESEFGVLLFERTGQGVRMTPLAVRLFAETRAIGDIENIARDILAASRALSFGELSVMCGAPNPAMQLIAEFKRLYPGVRVTATFGDWHEVRDALMTHRCDAAIVTEAPADPDLSSVPYVGQKVVALVPPEHFFARRGAPVSLHELVDQPVVFRTETSLTQEAVNAALKACGLILDPVIRLGAREALYEAVTQGLGIGFMFEQAVTRSDGPVRLPIVEMPQIYMEHVTCLSRNMRRREVAAFMRLAGEIAVV